MLIAFVLPVLNEAASGLPALQALQPARARGARVVVADGGSTDATPELAAAWADAVIQAPRGRAAQMNAGAQLALRCATDRRPHVLCFVHADTVLPADADLCIAKAVESGADWGRFDVTIDGAHPMLRVVAALMNARSRYTRMCTGDQAMFVRALAWQAVGGFAPQPLMEDLELSERLLERAFAPLRARARTSGRRWETQGVWRTIALMWQLRWAYWHGAAPQVLAKRYGYRVRPGAAIAIMTKAPVPGFAKTRLVTLLGAAGAARAHRSLMLRQIQACQQASLGPLTLWCAPDTAHRCFRALAHFGPRLSWAVQASGDLGLRMSRAMQTHFAGRTRLPWIVVGTDCPMLDAQHLQAMADALLSHDAVIVPAEDGGYVALGLARAAPGVFEGVDWSTDQVLRQTLDRLAIAGLSVHVMPTLWDVDEPKDWVRWRKTLAAAPDTGS